MRERFRFNRGDAGSVGLDMRATLGLITKIFISEVQVEEEGLPDCLTCAEFEPLTGAFDFEGFTDPGSDLEATKMAATKARGSLMSRISRLCKLTLVVVILFGAFVS